MSCTWGDTVTRVDSEFQREGRPGAQAAEEAGVVAAAKAGDFEAFEELVNRSEKRIYRLGLTITGSPEDAEDILQETFLKAFAHLSNFREDSRFHTWLVRIAVNEGLMNLRKRRADRSVPMEDRVNDKGEVLPREFADWRPNPEQIFEQTELRTILERAMRKLPLHYRTVFLLRDVEGYSTEEAASILNLRLSTAKIRIFRARLRLREQLSRKFRQQGNYKPKKMKSHA